MASITVLSAHRNRREMDALMRQIATRRPHKRREYLEGYLERLADQRRSLGMSAGWILAERNNVLAAIEPILDSIPDFGPERTR